MRRVVCTSLLCLPTMPPGIHTLVYTTLYTPGYTPVHTRPTYYRVHSSTTAGVRGDEALGSRWENGLGGRETLRRVLQECLG